MKTKLFDGSLTPTQAAIIGFWLVNLVVIVILWQQTSFDLLLSGASGLFTAIGRLLGLLAAFFALTQFVLNGRLPWLERPFGLDHLASYHRKNGYYAYILILLHPLFITTGYALASENNYIRQYIDLILNYPNVWLALIAEILFTVVVVSSIYIVRKKLKFESWYYVHLLVYIAIVTAFFHQVTIGGSFLGNPVTQFYWYGLYGFVALNLAIWRFGLPLINMYRYGFRIDHVKRETPTTVSVYIKGRNFKQLGAQGGQFVFVRILADGYFLQEHPFSLSAVVADNQLRITVREVGDYTKTLINLKPGSRVLLAGPFGRFTKVVAHTKKRLYIAGGVGITPLRSMIEDTINDDTESVLIYANHSPDDVVFDKELAHFQAKGLARYDVFSDIPDSHKGAAIKGRVDADLIKKLVPEYKKYDIYLCGPPPMMTGIIDGFTANGLQPSQLHYENFSLHR